MTQDGPLCLDTHRCPLQVAQTGVATTTWPSLGFCTVGGAPMGVAVPCLWMAQRSVGGVCGLGTTQAHSQAHSPCLQSPFLYCSICLVWGMPVGLVSDSGLDASSQYPSLGSFTTPAARLMVETRGVPQGFLSYYHVMPSSRPRKVGGYGRSVSPTGTLPQNCTLPRPVPRWGHVPSSTLNNSQSVAGG